MKYSLVILFIFFAILSNGFTQEKSFERSNLYWYSYENLSNFKRKFYEHDTLINNENFKKYRWETLGSGRSISKVTFNYEILDDNHYVLLDSNLNTIHSFYFKSGIQYGTLFYKEQEIYDSLFLEISQNFGEKMNYLAYKGKQMPYSGVYFNEEKTNVEYSRDISAEIYNAEGDSFKINYNNSFVHLYGDPIDLFCELFDKGIVYPEKPPSFNIIGDKIQYLFYADIDTHAKLKDSNIPLKVEPDSLVGIYDVEYIGDTLINGERNFILKQQIARLKEGKVEEEIIYSIINNYQIKDSYNRLEDQAFYKDVYPHFNDGDEIKIFSAYSTDSTLGINLDYVMNSWFMPYWGNMTVKYFIDFPYPIVYVSTQKTVITYVKIDGVEYGERMIIPDSVTTNEILSASYSNGKMFVEFRLNGEYDIYFDILEKKENVTYKRTSDRLSKGIHKKMIDFDNKNYDIENVITLVIEYHTVSGDLQIGEMKEVIQIE